MENARTIRPMRFSHRVLAILITLSLTAPSAFTACPASASQGDLVALLSKDYVRERVQTNGPRSVVRKRKRMAGADTEKDVRRGVPVQGLPVRSEEKQSSRIYRAKKDKVRQGTITRYSRPKTK